MESVITIIPRVFAAALVILLFGGIALFVRWLIRVTFHRAFSDLTVENLVKQLAYYTIWVLGIIVAAALGFDPQTVVTGLGLTSLALGFALKDIISNFISGILLLALRPFKIGDQIVVGETEGSVERIELRATQIKTYDGRTALVPNADVFTSRVINNTASPERGGAVEFFLDYGCDLRRAISIISEATRRAEGVLQTPTPTVRVKNLTENAMQIEALFRTDSRRADFMATASAIRHNALNALKDAGIDLPDSNLRVLKTDEESRWRIGINDESKAAMDGKSANIAR
jgi:small-conductance mechanosensitive channel